MWRWIGGLVVATSACGTLIKPPDPNRRLNVHTEGTTFEADRGYRFVVLPEPTANVVRLDVRYPVGSIDDPIGKEGLAHLAEHLLTEVEITHDGVKTSLDGEMSRVALSFNAHTTTDYTTYEALALPSALDDLMRIEAERLTIGCAGIPRELFEREREVVRNELRERGGRASAELRRGLYASIYPPGHPYRRVDSEETVAQITYDDLCAFLAGPYRRGTPIVSLSGAVDVGAVQQAVNRHFTQVPKRVVAPRLDVPLATPMRGTISLKAALDEPTLVITWPLPAMSTPQYRLLEMAWSRIAGNLEDYAFRFEWGHSASTEILGGPRAPVLAVSVVLDSENDLDEARSRVGSALRDMYYQLSRPGDDRETPAWVRKWEGEIERLLARWESLDGRNDLYADFQQFDPQGSVTARIKELATATPTGARALAEKWLTPSRAHYILLQPSGSSDVDSSGTFGTAVEQHGARVDDTLADKPLPRPDASLRLQTERYTQENGLTVVLWSSGLTPLVHARLVVDAGASDAPFGMEGVSQTVGASAVYADALVFDDRSLGNRIDDLVLSLASELRRPGYGLSDEARKYLIARLSQQRVVERDAYDTDVLLALYGEGHPYARSMISASGVKHLSHDSVQDWARSHIAPKNSTLVIAGAFDPGLVKRHVAYSTEQVSAGQRSRDLKTSPRTSPGFVVGITTKPSPTLELAAHFVGGRGIDDDYPRRLVLEAVLRAQFAELREKRALTYGFSASYEPRRAGGIWTIAGQVDAARAVEAGQAIAVILDQLRRAPEAYRSAFVLGRQKVLETLLANTTSTAAVADRLAFLARFGLDDDYYDTLANGVASLTISDLHAFVVRELAADHQVLGAFGNSRPAKAAIAAARAVDAGQRPATVVDPFR